MYTPDSWQPTIRAFVPDQVYIAKAPLRFYGIPMGTRMTVVRLSSGKLWVHSPIPLATVKNTLDTLGEPEFVVAPNFLHHLYVGPFLKVYPQARLFVSPRLEMKRADLSPEGVLGDAVVDDTWGADIDQALCAGSKFMDEVVFFHRESRTLVLCDLLESMHHDAPWRFRQLGRLMGVYERPGPPIDMKLSFRDKSATRRFVERVLDWDFDRIVMSHGNLIEQGGKDIFCNAFAFVL